MTLHDGIPTSVALNKCPFDANFAQERYIKDFWGHYRDKHLVIEISGWPQWIKEGTANLTNFMILDEEKEAK